MCVLCITALMTFTSKSLDEPRPNAGIAGRMEAHSELTLLDIVATKLLLLYYC